MKRCSACKIEKEESEFNKSSDRKDGLSNNCKECNKAQLKAHYYANSGYYLDKNYKRREKIKKYVDSKKIKCEECGENHIACLDFHHERDKVMEISLLVNRMWSSIRIDEEMAKCKILCSNCHRKLHYNERQSRLV